MFARRARPFQGARGAPRLNAPVPRGALRARSGGGGALPPGKPPGGPPGASGGCEDSGDDGQGRRRSGRLLRLLAACAAASLATAAPALASARGKQKDDARRKKDHAQSEDTSGGLLQLGGAVLAALGIQGIVSQQQQQGEQQQQGKQQQARGRGLSSSEVDAFVDSMLAMWRPILSNMGISGVMGACSAAALKVVGRTLAAFLGLGFVGLQVLTYTGFVTVNWTKVSDQARAVLDSTKDGRLDIDDFRADLKRGLVVLSQGLPSTSGFLVGFMLGLRMF